MGCVGMSMNDFERCTPSEFRCIWESWLKQKERIERDGWERVRMECLHFLQPYSKKKLGVLDIMKFPWDHEHSKTERRDETREEIAARYASAKKKFGLN